eukprot:4252709-Pleurochrysis_carterae.AAC.1
MCIRDSSISPAHALPILLARSIVAAVVRREHPVRSQHHIMRCEGRRRSLPPLAVVHHHAEDAALHVRTQLLMPLREQRRGAHYQRRRRSARARVARVRTRTGTRVRTRCAHAARTRNVHIGHEHATACAHHRARGGGVV